MIQGSHRLYNSICKSLSRYKIILPAGHIRRAAGISHLAPASYGGLHWHCSKPTDPMRWPLYLSSIFLFFFTLLSITVHKYTMTGINTRVTLIREGEGHGASQQRGNPLATDIQDSRACANYTPWTRIYCVRVPMVLINRKYLYIMFYFLVAGLLMDLSMVDQ